MTGESTTDSNQTPTTEPPAADAPNPATDSSSSTTSGTDSSNEEATTLLGGGGDGGSGGATDGEEAPAETEEQKAAREADEARAALFGAPEGDYELTLPEGVTDVDKEALAAVTPVAKELGLSNEGLSKIAGVYATDVLPHIAKQIVSGIERDVAAQTAAWANETKLAIEGGKDGDIVIEPDPVFAGKSLRDVQATAAKAIDRFGGKELREYFEQTGLGNHKTMVRAMYLAGSAISEDTSFERGTTGTAPKTREELYYGSSAKTTT